MSKSREPSSTHVEEVVARSHSRRAVSRPRGSRNRSLSSIPYLPQGPEALINPDGQIGDEAAELLHEFVHPHRHQTEDTLIQEEFAEEEEEAEGSPSDDDFEESVAEWRQGLPWWKRPSPLWFLVLVPFSAVAMSATIAPRVEIYTQLACDAYKPEYRAGRGDEHPLSVLQKALSTVVPLSDKTYELCASDPVVQKAVAKLSLAMISTGGILGCLTTGWWGSLSDRIGRTRIMSLAAIGMLTTDCSFIVTANFWRVLPGGYWFLIFGPIVEGSLGGISTVSAAIHAYIADCTEPSARSRTFSLFLGLLFTGMSFGPTLASLYIGYTGYVLGVFYIATAVHILYAILIWFVIPESLSCTQLAQSKQLYTKQLDQQKDVRTNGGALLRIRRIFGFLAPIALLFPAVVDDSPLKKRKRDWSLLLLAVAYGFVVLIMGSVTSKMQYMTMVYGWSAEQVGYWTSTVSAARALHLTIILPVLISFLQPKAPAIQLPVERDEPLGPSSGSSTESAPSSPQLSQPAHQHHSPAFDLKLARASICLEIVAYFFMSSAPNGTWFTVYSVLGAFGAGFGPAMNSIASALYTKNGGKELGKLFGALSVVQIVCAQVLGPFLYGITYLRTVATFPQAIFAVSVGTLVVSLTLLVFIRLPNNAKTDVEDQVYDALDPPHPEREATLVDVQGPLIIVEDVDEERGRKLVVKPTSAGTDE